MSDEKAQPWVMPDWMRPYESSFQNTGGNTVEDLMNRLLQERNLAASNIIVFTMAASISAQVDLLHRLRWRRLLREERDDVFCDRCYVPTAFDQTALVVNGDKRERIGNCCLLPHEVIELG
jgi:hypothetical protein